MAFRIHHFEYSRMTFSALVWEKHFPYRWAKITTARLFESVAWPLSGNSDVSGDFPQQKNFQATPYLRHSAVISDFRFQKPKTGI